MSALNEYLNNDNPSINDGSFLQSNTVYLFDRECLKFSQYGLEYPFFDAEG